MLKHGCIVFSSMLMLVIALLAACDGDSDKTDNELTGALPSLTVGDTWTQRGAEEGTEYTLIYKMMGEVKVDGKDCYDVHVESDPLLFGLTSNVSLKIEKATMDIIQNRFSGEMQGEPFDAEISYTYEYTGTEFPYEVGKSWEVTESEISTITISGEISTETETSTYTNKVEGTETVTVPAGTFECFKITVFDDAGTLLETSWLSDETKLFDVKTLDNETGEAKELISFSVS